MIYMKDIKCAINGHFYISVPNDATPDDIEDALIKYINNIEEIVQDGMSINEFTWEECES